MTETEVRDPGVAVYWTDRRGEARVMACDQWFRLRDNVHAIGHAVAAFRTIERCVLIAAASADPARLCRVPRRSRA
jgi:hypothetical protein